MEHCMEDPSRVSDREPGTRDPISHPIRHPPAASVTQTRVRIQDPPIPGTPMPDPIPFEQADTASAAPALGSSARKPSIQQPPGYGLGRRAHKKSRTGCSTCKARKIKCDERHPACLNCISHGVECPFLKGVADTAAARHPPARTKSQSPISPASTAASSPGPNLAAPEELPLLQLELLHNFTTKTYTTLTADPSLWDFWRDDVVQLGLSCDYIMRAVLAISALHLAYHRPDRRDFYTAQGILLHQKASRSAMRFMAADRVVDKDQAASLFLFSMLTMFFALAAPRRSNPDGSFFIGESGIPDWAFLLSGGKSIMQGLGWEDARFETVAAPFLIYGARRWHAHRAKVAEMEQQHHHHHHHHHHHSATNTPSTSSPTSASPPGNPSSALLLAPLRARISATVADPSHLQAYTHALDELELALVVRQDPAAPRDVLDAMVWLWEVSGSLVPLLKAPAQQAAVAIFAHFGVLLKHHDSHWWLQGWADHLMARAHEILDAEHRAWIEWPMREMGYEAPPAA
ncbi:hypothetical protein BT67DRAFT_440154 [Trichocladium antarcticum]|uniref:Zn(2)-C6 fungal-type domain-containing protein n=1 Tax=Trichocladium antarcticum TaxID=1450529 RepID=A0AAN6UMY9_9PEZI|nr:hypothetical protein BT67DRAFT_440154 [Trichocladium antarcticum]